MRPPTGLHPRSLSTGDPPELRAFEIAEALGRYAQAARPAPPEWTDELAGLLDPSKRLPLYDMQRHGQLGVPASCTAKTALDAATADLQKQLASAQEREHAAQKQLAAAQEREHAARDIAGVAQQEVDDLERRILRWRVQPWWKRVYTAVFPLGRLP